MWHDMYAVFDLLVLSGNYSKHRLVLSVSPAPSVPPGLNHGRSSGGGQAAVAKATEVAGAASGGKVRKCSERL
jgi:hypothetical protein